MERLNLPQCLRRNTIELSQPHEQPPSNIVLCSDVEGPWLLGDFVAEAMAAKLMPENNPVDAFPSYGHIIYEQTWQWFTETTSRSRRTSATGIHRNSLSLSQEGTDTIFTLPLILAEGADDQFLERLALLSKLTPGSKELIKILLDEGVSVFGITTAPQEPCRSAVREAEVIDPSRIIGSPFPLDETREILSEMDANGGEIEMVLAYLDRCYRTIDDHSQITTDGVETKRNLSDQGTRLLRETIAKFHNHELGITFDPMTRKKRGPAKTVFGQIIEAAGIVGDRAKAALALSTQLKSGAGGKVLIAQGDGANDGVMLQKAEISIGINGADAAAAAKIAVVTDDMRNLIPIYELILSGMRDIDNIIDEAQRRVGSAAIICKGGPGVSEDILEEHTLMKKKLRGQFVTY